MIAILPDERCCHATPLLYDWLRPDKGRACLAGVLTCRSKWQPRVPELGQLLVAIPYVQSRGGCGYRSIIWSAYPTFPFHPQAPIDAMKGNHAGHTCPIALRCARIFATFLRNRDLCCWQVQLCREISKIWQHQIAICFCVMPLKMAEKCNIMWIAVDRAGLYYDRCQIWE